MGGRVHQAETGRGSRWLALGCGGCVPWSRLLSGANLVECQSLLRLDPGTSPALSRWFRVRPLRSHSTHQTGVETPASPAPVPSLTRIRNKAMSSVLGPNGFRSLCHGPEQRSLAAGSVVKREMVEGEMPVVIPKVDRPLASVSTTLSSCPSGTRSETPARFVQPLLACLAIALQKGRR